jgi:DNA-binding beta-propeller fold protein YncE
MRPSASSPLYLVLACLLPLGLIGCSVESTATPTADAGLAITGKVMGGQQAIVGARVYLFAANAGVFTPNATGYGNASLSLLTSQTGTTLDSNGGATNGDYYVTTGTAGAFSITGDYSCTANTQVYLYAVGGNAGSGANSAAGLLAVLGNCPGGASAFAAGTPYVVINEVSTVAAAYVFAGFATDAVHVSSSGTSLAKTGIANAFANAANLETIGTGVALATTPAGNGIVPQNEINTLANILASCVNSNGAVTGPTNPTACYTLFTNALSGGATGAQPTDTATAAINMAHNPGVNMTALYALSTATPPFGPALSTQPNDFTLGLIYSGGGLNEVTAFAIDSLGDIWLANELNPNSNISEFSPTGAALSPSTGFTGGGLNTPNGLAIDNSGNVWASSFANISVNEFRSNGTPISTSSGYTGGGLNNARSVAIDTLGDAWLANIGANSLSEFNSGGNAITTASGYTGGGLNNPRTVAIDGSANVWVPSQSGNSISKFNSAGTPVSASGYTGGGLNGPKDLALDSSGNVWVANNGGSTISKFNNNGTAITTSSGYSGGGLNAPIVVAIDGAGNVWAANQASNSVSEFNSSGTAITGSNGYTCAGCMNLPAGPVIDGSGNLWFANNNSTISELIGAATPVITPIVAGLPLTLTGNGSSNLGTRP